MEVTTAKPTGTGGEGTEASPEGIGRERPCEGLGLSPLRLYGVYTAFVGGFERLLALFVGLGLVGGGKSPYFGGGFPLILFRDFPQVRALSRNAPVQGGQNEPATAVELPHAPARHLGTSPRPFFGLDEDMQAVPALGYLDEQRVVDAFEYVPRPRLQLSRIGETVVQVIRRESPSQYDSEPVAGLGRLNLPVAAPRCFPGA